MPPTLKARPTTYKGIQMRSRLEAGFAMWLDKIGCDWEYEPGAFASERGQYLPDFKVTTCNLDTRAGHMPRLETAYVEVKPYLIEDDDGHWAQALAERMSIVWDSEPDADLLVFAPQLHHSPYRFPVDTPVLRLCHLGDGEGGRIGVVLIPHRAIQVAGTFGVFWPGNRIEGRNVPWYGDWWNG